MRQQCVKCGRNGHCKEACRTGYGRRRRYWCSCGNRWTVHFSHEEEAAYMESSQRLAHQERKLNEDSVRKILTSDENDGTLAKAYGVTRSLVGRIRTGKVYADVAPELQRRQPQVHVIPTCMNCALFTGNEPKPCSLCLPEATSTAAARWCGSFYPAEGEPELEAS